MLIYSSLFARSIFTCVCFICDTGDITTNHMTFITLIEIGYQICLSHLDAQRMMMMTLVLGTNWTLDNEMKRRKGKACHNAHWIHSHAVVCTAIVSMFSEIIEAHLRLFNELKYSCLPCFRAFSALLWKTTFIKPSKLLALFLSRSTTRGNCMHYISCAIRIKI